MKEPERMVFIHVSESIHWLITLPRWLCARTVRAGVKELYNNVGSPAGNLCNV